jgi:hypothetical protein
MRGLTRMLLIFLRMQKTEARVGPRACIPARMKCLNPNRPQPPQPAHP